MKILLVEDEEMLSAIIAKGLRKLRYAVDTVFDGEEALTGSFFKRNGVVQKVNPFKQNSAAKELGINILGDKKLF